MVRSDFEVVLADSLVSGFHLWTALRGAELGDGSIEQVDLVIEIDDCAPMSAVFRYSCETVLTIDSQPLVLVLALWKLHSLPQAAAS